MKVFSRTRSLAAGGLLAVVLAMLVPSAAEAKPEPGVRNRGFRLFARSLGGMTINRVYLGLNSARGEIGVDSTNSSTIGGGFWPRGTPNQYVFNSGLQVAGKISNPGGAWNGDVSGAFFFDPRGANANGDEVQPIYNFTNPDDAGAWPAAAVVAENNPADATYNTALLGLNSASQGDVWFMTWDGNPTLINGRSHPLGVVVESRGLGWNYPSGNQDIVYFIFNFYNITSINPADYASIRPDMRAILLEKATEFKSRNEATFGITLPDGGYTIDSLFAAFAADMDVTSSAGTNFCSVNLPFAMGFCWERSFTQDDAGFYNDPTVYGAPFFAGPGFVGVKYLKSPTGAGEIQLFSNTTNGGAFPDADNVGKLFRYLSGTINPAAGDNACLFNPLTENICFVNPVASDARFYQSSTALTLAPGGYGTIVVAYIFAAPVSIPGFVPTGTTNVTAGDPRRLVNEGSLQSTGANRIDSITGFRGFAGNGDGIVRQTEFNTVPGSLLNKGLTAQLVFDNGFLLPFAPTPPNFYLIPGDNSVTVAWQPSVTETQGDPYFAVASNPVLPPITPGDPPVANPAYDPNYRQFDVEGYRIYRGRVDAGSSLELLAQFDYGGTIFTDFTGQVQPSTQCGPEFVPPVTASCPVAFNYVLGSGIAPTVSIDYPLVGEIVQIKLGPESRQLLANGELFIFANSDTLLSGANTQDGPFPILQDNGVPFSFEDRSVRNNFRYFYAVTAFDVNSFQSGPATLESPRVTKAVTPVGNASNIAGAPVLSFEVTDPTGQPYTAGAFTIDAATGRFSGPPPATAASQVSNVAFQGAQTLWPALGPGDLTATIDSVKLRASAEPYPDDGIGSFDCQHRENGQGLCMEYFLTYRQPGKPPVQTRTPMYQPILTTTFGDDPLVETTTAGAAVPFDDAQLARYGVPAGVGSLQAAATIGIGQHGNWSGGENFNGRRDFASYSIGGSRWFQGANETVDQPAYSIRVGSGLTGVDSIYAALSHIDQQPLVAGVQPPGNSVCEQVYNYAASPFSRSADIQLTWGAGGTIASVRDITHRLDVPFGGSAGSNYGFMPDANGNGVIDWEDIAWLEGMIQVHNHLGFCPTLLSGDELPEPGDGANLSPTPIILPVSFLAPASEDPAAFLPGTGSGFGLYLAGHWHIFRLTGGVAPPAGTTWTLRSYSGIVRTTGTSNQGVAGTGYTFTPTPANPAISGLTINYLTSGAASDGVVSSRDLTNVHTVPDPYYITSGYEATTDNKVLQFVNLPSQAIIRIYTSSGILVNVLETNSQSFGGNLNWNLRNRNNQVVASGVYFYHVESGDARKVGRFTVVNFAQ